MLGKKNIFKRSNGSVNWPLTILLMGLAIFTIFGPLYMTLMIAVKDPSQMDSILSWPQTFHWSNFKEGWELTNYPEKFKNTLIITSINLVFTIFTTC